MTISNDTPAPGEADRLVVSLERVDDVRTKEVPRVIVYRKLFTEQLDNCTPINSPRTIRTKTVNPELSVHPVSPGLLTWHLGYGVTTNPER